MKLTTFVKLEPRDAWVGLFWDRRPGGLRIVICPIPFVAVFIELERSRPRCEVCYREHDLGEPDCLEWP